MANTIKTKEMNKEFKWTNDILFYLTTLIMSGLVLSLFMDGAYQNYFTTMFFTYWTGMFAWFYFFTQWSYNRIDNKFFNWTRSSLAWQGSITSYSVLVFVVILFMIGPVTVIEALFGVGPGAYGYGQEPLDYTSPWGALRSNASFYVHYILPIIMLVLWFNTKEKDNNMSKKTTRGWAIYIAIYVMWTAPNVLITGEAPYGYVSPNLIGYPQAIFNGIVTLIVWYILARQLILVKEPKDA